MTVRTPLVLIAGAVRELPVGDRLFGNPLWVSGTTYAKGDAALSPVDFCFYIRKTDGAGTTDPSADSANWQNSNGIKSIQRGVISMGTTSQAVTITSVNTSKAELRMLGFTSNSSTVSAATAYIALTDSTTITAYGVGSATRSVSWELTERF